MKYEELPPMIPIGRAKGILGNKFNLLTPLFRVENKKSNKVLYACKCDCGEYTVVESSHLKDGHTKSCGCLDHPNLAGKVFGDLKVIKRINDKGTGAKWLCQCVCGNTTVVVTRDLLNKHSQSCGCKRSRGEEKIQELLLQYNIPFETQKTFENCRFPNTNAKAKFDFYLPQFNLLIEFDGEQHFQYRENKGWNNKENFEKTKYRDKYKDEWCQKNNIKLIRIPYWDIDKISLSYIFSNY